MGITSTLVTIENGKRFARYARYIPRPTLERLLFGTAVFRAMRGSRPAVWRPLAEAALGEALVVRISPERITGLMPETLAFKSERVETRFWFVLPGDWDINPMRLEDHWSYPRMRDLLSGDLERSPSYRELIAQEQQGTLPDRVEKLGGVNAYFELYRELAHKMAQTNSVPNFGPEDKDRYVGIAIGRNGQIIQQQKGHHRSIIAQFVPCDAMEAKVLAVHPLWVRRVALCGSFAETITNGIASLGVQ